MARTNTVSAGNGPAIRAARAAGVWIERAERDPRLDDAEPIDKSPARHVRGSSDGSRGYSVRHITQGEVRRREDYPQR
jgi:hypothetical protein